MHDRDVDAQPRVRIRTSQSLFLSFIPSDKSSCLSCNRHEKSPSIAHSWPSEEKRSTCLRSTCGNGLTRFCNTGSRTQSRDRRTQSRGSRALHMLSASYIHHFLADEKSHRNTPPMHPFSYTCHWTSECWKDNALEESLRDNR